MFREYVKINDKKQGVWEDEIFCKEIIIFRKKRRFLDKSRPQGEWHVVQKRLAVVQNVEFCNVFLRFSAPFFMAMAQRFFHAAELFLKKPQRFFQGDEPFFGEIKLHD